MAQDLINETMTDVQRDAMLADLAAFATKWAPYTVNLTPAQIANLAKLKPTDLALLEVGQTYSQLNPAAISADMNIGKLDTDIALARQAIIVNADAQQIANITHNTVIAVLSDAFVTCNAVYRVEKAKGRNPQNAAFLDAYGARFAHGAPPAPPAPNP